MSKRDKPNKRQQQRESAREFPGELRPKRATPYPMTRNDRVRAAKLAVDNGLHLAAIAQALTVLAETALKAEPADLNGREGEPILLSTLTSKASVYGVIPEPEAEPTAGTWTFDKDATGKTFATLIAPNVLPVVPDPTCEAIETGILADCTCASRSSLHPGDGGRLWRGKDHIWRFTEAGSWARWANGGWQPLGPDANGCAGMLYGPYNPMPSWVTWQDAAAKADSVERRADEGGS